MQNLPFTQENDSVWTWPNTFITFQFRFADFTLGWITHMDCLLHGSAHHIDAGCVVEQTCRNLTRWEGMTAAYRVSYFFTASELECIRKKSCQNNESLSLPRWSLVLSFEVDAIQFNLITGRNINCSNVSINFCDTRNVFCSFTFRDCRDQ